ncbi:hypothetical protein BSKO_09628 [Bryopsis sp. KO-2023]|nr:hypothetical protein BSKO_09628 [Bryopsis sp. KO-2023]
MTFPCDGRSLSQEMMRPRILGRARFLYRPLLSNNFPGVASLEALSRHSQHHPLRRGILSSLSVRCSASTTPTSWGEYLGPLVERSRALDSHIGELSEEQKRAVYDNHKVVRVVAGPGSGKTRVLTARVALLLMSGVKPENFLILTFTNKASRELKERLVNIVGKAEFDSSLKYMWMGTFHGMAHKILRREIQHLKSSYKNNFTIYDADDTCRVVHEILMRKINLHDIPKGASQADKKAIRKLNAEIRKNVRTQARELAEWILRVKDCIPDIHKLSSAEIYAQTESMPILRENFCNMYTAYHRVMRRKNALDFADLISLTTAILEKNPEIRQKYVSKFQHILVDEVQDTDNCQYRLLKLLASAKRTSNELNMNTLFVVGDPNQAIYGFRGANMENMAVNLQRDFPKDISTQNLRDNYRSYSIILRGAEAVLRGNVNTLLHKALNPVRNGEGIVEIHKLLTEKSEASFVAKKMKECHRDGIPYSEMGVLFRTRDVARNLEQYCTQSGVPYKSLAGPPFWQRREVKDIMCYLRFVCNPDDEMAFERIVNTPARGIGPVAYDILKEWAEKNTEKGFPGGLVDDLMEEVVDLTVLKGIMNELQDNSTLQDILDEEPAKIISESAPKKMKMSKAALRGLSNIRNIFVLLRSLAVHKGVLSAVEGVLLGAGYQEWILEGKIGDGDPKDRMFNVQILKSAASQLSEGQAGLHHLEEFAQNAVLWSDEDLNDSNLDRASIATMHSAKGLEFQVVFLCGFEEGLVPHSYEGAVNIEEETRLAYVAISRAKDRLYITHTQGRNRFKFREENEESRFLKQIRSTGITQEMSCQESSRNHAYREWHY